MDIFNSAPQCRQIHGFCHYASPILWRTVVAVIVLQLDLQQPVLSVPITTDVVSSNLEQGEVYNIMW